MSGDINTSYFKQRANQKPSLCGHRIYSSPLGANACIQGILAGCQAFSQAFHLGLLLSSGMKAELLRCEIFQTT
jgi:hypothetical protein